jgi:hypothetical protein
MAYFSWSRLSVLGVFATCISLLALLSPWAKDIAATAVEPNNPAQGEYVYIPMVTQPFSPLYLGFSAYWSGVGYLRLGIYETVGTHITRDLDQLVDSGTGRVVNIHWYDPDPYDWGTEWWYEFYSLSDGSFLSSSTPGDPSWKWGFVWLVPYDFQFHDGQEVNVGGQNFSVSGPHSGFTSFGKPVNYWQLINKEKFLFFDDGGDLTQYVHAGDAKLRYDAGRTRLLIQSDVKRTFYEKGEKTQYNVQYVQSLSYANTWPNISLSGNEGAYSQPAIISGNQRLENEFTTGARDPQSFSGIGPIVPN